MDDDGENMSDSDFGEDEDPDKIEVPGTRQIAHNTQTIIALKSNLFRWRQRPRGRSDNPRATRLETQARRHTEGPETAQLGRDEF